MSNWKVANPLNSDEESRMTSRDRLTMRMGQDHIPRKFISCEQPQVYIADSDSVMIAYD